MSAGGGFHGFIQDSDHKPVRQVMIRVTGGPLAGFQGAATGDDGRWCIPYLPTGNNYIVEAYHPTLGYSRTLADLKFGEDVEVAFTLWYSDRVDFPALPEREERELPVPWEFCPSCGKRMPPCNTMTVDA